MGQLAWCSCNDTLSLEKAGTVGCSKTGLTWTTLRQREGDLYVAALIAAWQGSPLHFTLDSPGQRSVNDWELGKSMKGCSYLFIKHKDTRQPAVYALPDKLGEYL